MITIPLSKNGYKHAGKYEAIVDDCDANIATLNWLALITKRVVYAIRFPSKTVGITHILMHRVILSRKLGRPLNTNEIVDHINNNGLDNRRVNLRVATPAQIRMNVRRSTKNKLGFKGVKKRGNRYRSVIRINGKQIHLGYFDTPEQAHAAYCAAAKEYFGEFANEG